MATKDFKIRHSLTVAENATIEGNLTLGGNTISRLIDSDEVTTIINSSTVSSILTDSDSIETIYGVLSGPVSFRAKNDTGSTIFPGTAVYISGISGNTPLVRKANASSAATMPAFGITSDTANNGSEVQITTFGTLTPVPTDQFTIGSTVYISADSDGALTNTKPTGASELIQNIGIVTRVHPTDGSIKVGGAGRTNDIDNATRAKLDSDSAAIQATRTEMDVSFNIVNNGASAYTFSGDGFPSGVDNPTLYLNRGHTYNFRVNASGHPFEIRLSNGGSAYSSGVTNNAAQIGEVKFVVPMDAPETLVYQCTVHSGMVGTIKIGKQGFDSDQITSMILENSSGSGMTDSDLAVVAKLRADVDSDSIKLQALEETVAGLSSGMTDSDLKVVADLRNDVDSDSIKLQALQETVAGLSGGGGSGMTDSDLKVVADLRNDLDSELRASRTTLSISRFDYTATQGQTLFSGADDNGNTLSYVSSKIQVFLNGVLMLDNTDYTANNGTSLTLTVAADSDDKLSIIKYLGVAAEAINITRFTYKYGVDGNGIVGDSDITGNDEHGNTLSYTAGKIQVYSNGILLEDSDDYIATDGSTITLRAAPDSDDVVSIFKYLGTIQSGFDSDQINSQILELLKPVVSASSDFADFKNRIAAL